MTLVPFDDRDGWIWLDGRMVPWREAKLHVLSHGLHYASAVFEGERAYGGTIFALREHSERLIRSASLLGFEIPFSVAVIESASQEVLTANGLVDAYVRPVAWRGPERLSVAANGAKTRVAIACWEWPNQFGSERERGIRMEISRWRRPDPKTAPTDSKAAGLYMTSTLARDEAEAKGLDDALMLDWRGGIAEATGANVFLVIDGILHTPAPDCFLDGITRRTVMALAARRGMAVVEGPLALEALDRASEVFVTGTAAEVTAVREIGAHAFTPGQITEVLQADYARAVRGSVAEVSRSAA